MGSKSILKANYEVEATYDAYFTGQHVQITKDGSAVLCDCGDSVGVVALDTGRVTGRITIEEDLIVCLSLSPDNSTIAVALKSQSVRLYQWPSLELLRTFRSYHTSPVTAIAWDASSSLLATGAADSTARIWDLKGKYCTHSLKGASGVFGYIMFDKDLMTQPRVYGAVNNDIFVWELAAGSSSCVAKLQGHHSAVTSLAMTHDRSSMVSVGLDRVIILWDLATMTSKKIVPVFQSLSGLVLQPPEGSPFPGASIDDDHIYALVVGDKGIPAVWQVDAGKEVWRSSTPIATPPPGQEGGVTLVRQVLPVASLDSILMTTYDHSIVLLKSNTLDVWKQLAGYNEQIFDAIFVGPDDSHLVIATNSPQLRIYDSTSLNCRLIFGHTAIILALSRHPTNPRIFASSAHDMSVRVWLVKEDGSAVCIATANGHTASVGSIALGPGFMVSGSRDTCLKRWDMMAIENHPLVRGKGEGDVAAVTSSHTERAHDKDINGVSISINGRYIASASQDKTAKIWDGKTMRLLGVLNGHRKGLWCVQFSPTDEVVATASADTTIKIWTLSDFSNAVTLEGHETGVLRLAWVSRGQQMISTSSDGLLKLWTVKSRVCTASLDGHDDRTWALAVSGFNSEGNEGAVLFTGGEDAKLVRWKDVTQEELDKANEEAAKLASMEQTLANLLNDKKWAKALRISLRLDQPFRTLKIVRALLDESPDQLSAVLHRLPSAERDVILRYSVQWNTKTRSCREAQIIVNTLLHDLSPEDFEKSDGWKETLEGLLPYTERHMNRLSSLHQSSAILKYLANSLSLAAPLDNNDFGRSIHEDTGVASQEMETNVKRAVQPLSLDDLDVNFTIERVVAESSDDDDDEDEDEDEDDEDEEEEEEEMVDEDEEDEEEAMETQNVVSREETEILKKGQVEAHLNDLSMEVSELNDKIDKEMKELRDMKASRKKSMEKKVKKTQILLKV